MRNSSKSMMKRKIIEQMVVNNDKGNTLITTHKGRFSGSETWESLGDHKWKFSPGNHNSHFQLWCFLDNDLWWQLLQHNVFRPLWKVYLEERKIVTTKGQTFKISTIQKPVGPVGLRKDNDNHREKKKHQDYWLIVLSRSLHNYL